MGYWINHHVRATGSKEDIEAYISKLTQRRPDKLNDEGDIVWSEEEFSFYNITPPPEELLMSGDWWTETGVKWRQEHWQCYDAPAEEVQTFNFNMGTRSVATIRIDTKYDWPIAIFHTLISQYPSLEFYIWSEGEESEAIEIKGISGGWTQTEYESPNCHADYDARDMLDSCWCNQYEDSSEWYEDCPRDNPGLFKVVVTHTHYVTAQSMKEAMDAIQAYDNGFDMPQHSSMTKYNPVPEILITPAEVAE